MNVGVILSGFSGEILTAFNTYCLDFEQETCTVPADITNVDGLEWEIERNFSRLKRKFKLKDWQVVAISD